MGDDSDSEILNDLLANCEEPEHEKSKSEIAVKELDFNFLDTDTNVIKTSSPKKCVSLIHDDNLESSDDEDKKYFQKQNYSELGREIKHILKKVESEKKDNLINREVLRESKNSFDFNNAKTNNLSQSNGSHPSSNFSQSNNLSKTNNSSSSKSCVSVSSNDVYSDPIFGLRIIKPLISSAELKERMLGRTPVTISKVKYHISTDNLQDDWVIAGVVINKSPVMKSQKGSQYCIWKISDLSMDSMEMNVVSLFIFSNAFKELWKVATGAVVGVLNPNVLDQKDNKELATLSVDNPQKVMILGTSKDMATCKGTTKSGNPCTKIVNRKTCEYCVYHMQKAYKQCSRRADIQSSGNGRGLGTPFANSKNLSSKKVHAAITQGQPQHFFGIPAKRNHKLYNKDCETLARLTASYKTEKREKSESENKDLDNNKNVEKGPESESKYPEAKRKMVELTNNQMKKDLNRLNKLKEIASKSENESQVSVEEKDSIVNKSILNSSGSTKKEGFTLSKLQDLNAKESLPLLSKTLTFSRSKLQEWTEKQGFAISPQSDNKTSMPLNLNCLSKSSNSKSSNKSLANSLSSLSKSTSNSLDFSSNPTFSFPCLGNGITSGSIDFSEPITKPQIGAAKLNALKWIRENGGLKRSNPNKILLSKEKREQVLKRKREPENDKEDTKLKECKKLSNRFKEMMEATSSHTNLIEKSEEEEKEKYFGKLEMKEKLEEKIMTTFKIPCKAVICLICKYTSFSRSDMCKELGHQVKVVDAVKRFFKCNDCGNRTVSLDKLPKSSCNKCNSSNWKKAAMMDEKKVQIPGAILSLRGGEEKFIGSCMNDGNLNLLVPE